MCRRRWQITAVPCDPILGSGARRGSGAADSPHGQKKGPGAQAPGPRKSAGGTLYTIALIFSMIAAASSPVF